MAEHDVEQVWQEFWVPVLDEAVADLEMVPSIAMPGVYFEQIKRELYDYHRLMSEVGTQR